jgi:PAS domain S-box-containing protein
LNLSEIIDVSSALKPRIQGLLRFGLPGLVLVFGLMVTVGLWHRARLAYQREVLANFDYRSRDALARIEARLRYYEQALLSTRGLFQTRGSVTRKEFATFVEAADVDVHYPGIQGIGFSLLVPASELDRHAAQIRTQGFPDYRIRPEGQRKVYSSIIYLEPFKDRNLRAFGYDMFSEPVRQEAMCRARDTGHTAMSGKVTLVQETNTEVQAGFLVYVPVFQDGPGTQTLANRRQNLIGWVYATFRMNDLMRGVLGEAGSDLDMEVYDGPEARTETMMFDRDPDFSSRDSVLVQSSHTLSFGGHTWTVVTQAMPGLLGRIGKDISLTVLSLGALVSLLLGWVTLLMARQTNRVRQINELLGKRVEARTQELQAALDHLQKIASRVPGVVYQYRLRPDGSSCFPFASEAIRDIYRVSPEEVREDASRVFTILHPDDLAGVAASILASAESLTVWQCEYRVKYDDGTVRFLFSNAMPQREADGSILWHGFITDVTERKQAEQALRKNESHLKSILGSTTDGLLVIDNQRRILYFNGRFTDIWRIPAELVESGNDQDLLGQALCQLMDARPFLEKVEALYGSDLEDLDTLDFLDGRTIERYSTPLLIEGAISGRVWSFRDITGRKAAERALQRLNETLEQRVGLELERRLNQERAMVHQSRLAAMGEMVGNIAHQWRQPLNALAMVLANLQDARRHDQLTDEYFGASIQQGNLLVQSMSSTITDFMDFFRPDKAPVGFSVRQQARIALQLVSPSLNHHHIEVAFQDGPEAWALGHPNEFSQVLLNLLINARDAIQASASPHGRIRMDLSLEAATARLSISDNGGGIRVTPIERIFEPYFTDKPTGTGLGLYMSRMLLEVSMQGAIEARNIPGGAEFSVILPLVEPPHDHDRS